MRNHDDVTAEFAAELPATTVESAAKPATRPGRRASILAGLTLGAAAVVIVGQEFTTVVSYVHMHA
jgi:hypothetical protein